MATAAERLPQAAPLAPRALRWRVGMITLATDHVSEWDFASMRPHEDLAVYVNRVAFANPANKENLLAMGPRLTEAADLILPGESLDAIAYSCTAASALIGDTAVREAILAAKPGVPVVTPTSGAIGAFAALGVGKISVLTPYSEEVTEALVGYLAGNGLDIVSAACFGLADDREIARVEPAYIVEAAQAARDSRAEALFISCTALRAACVAQAIEERLGIPVVTSNQAMFWQTIRRAGCTLPVSGFGRLLRSH